jgi:L-iditol 2-dehydrogenase
LNLIRKLGRFAHPGPTAIPSRSTCCSAVLVTSRGIVTHRYRLQDWDEAIAMAKSLDSIKVLMEPAG